jgi:DNA-binding CsgD family transcriptional regulator
MLRKLLFFLFFFNSIVLSSQNNLLLDSLSTETTIKTHLDYYHDISKKETIKTIQERAFSFYGNKIFPGEQEQKFWFKLRLTKPEKHKGEFFFLLNTVSIDKIVFYQNIGSGYEKQYEFIKNGEKNIEIPINFTTTSDFLFEVSFTKSIYFPIQIENKQCLDKLHKTNLVIYGLYYGFVLFVLLINLFFYRQTKERFFLYYILLTLSIALILFELDGLVYLLFGNVKWILFIDVVLHTFLLASFALFTSEALQLNTYIPKLKWFGIAIVLLNILSFLIYVSTNSLFPYSLGELFNLIGLLTYWFIGILFFKRLIFARFMFIAYSVIIITNIIYVLPSEFGMADIGFTPTTFKIGSIIEMLIFLYAISYRHKTLSKEKIHIEQELESHKKELLEKNQKTEISAQQKLENFNDKFNLTNREIEVLDYIIKGKNNKEIASGLFLTEATVKYHCSKLYIKTKVKNRSQLTALFNSL